MKLQRNPTPYLPRLSNIFLLPPTCASRNRMIPFHSMKLSPSALKQFQIWGRQGGVQRRANNSKAQLSRIAKRAAATRKARRNGNAA